MSAIGSIVDGLLGVPAPVAYTVIGLLTFGEAAVFIGFILPGETAVLLGGVMAASGRLSLAVLLILVVACAIVGDTVGYEVGKHFGPRLLQTRPMRSHEHRIDGGRRVLRERGGWAVLLARFTAFLRAVMPGLAGLARMPYRRFLFFNAVGGLIWGVGVVLLGYLAGNSYARVASNLGRGTTILLGVVILAAVVLFLRARQRREHTD